jgi:hypothetical protein
MSIRTFPKEPYEGQKHCRYAGKLPEKIGEDLGYAAMIGVGRLCRGC